MCQLRVPKLTGQFLFLSSHRTPLPGAEHSGLLRRRRDDGAILTSAEKEKRPTYLLVGQTQIAAHTFLCREVLSNLG